MPERLDNGPEQLGSVEHKHNAEKQEQRAERPRVDVEQEKHKQEKQAEHARHSAEKEAISGKEHAPKHAEKKRQSAPKHVKKQNYKLTMNRVEAKLPAYQRAFSRVVRNDAVDAVSNVAAKTVARPSGILGGGIMAFIGMTVTLYFARQVGFTLSGSEFIALTFGGYLLGVLIEVVYKEFRSLKR